MYYKMIVGKTKMWPTSVSSHNLGLFLWGQKKLMLGIMTLNWWSGKISLEAKDLNEQYYGNALNVAIVPKQLR
jgi:hypothetical protein